MTPRYENDANVQEANARPRPTTAKLRLMSQKLMSRPYRFCGHNIAVELMVD